MNPIFEIPTLGPIKEVRVGEDVYPAHELHEERNGVDVRVYVVEAPKDVGARNEWPRRFDLESLRKRHYQAKGAALADEMRQADEDAELREFQTQLEARGDSNPDVAPTGDAPQEDTLEFVPGPEATVTVSVDTATAPAASEEQAASSQPDAGGRRKNRGK